MIISVDKLQRQDSFVQYIKNHFQVGHYRHGCGLFKNMYEYINANLYAITIKSKQVMNLKKRQGYMTGSEGLKMKKDSL